MAAVRSPAVSLGLRLSFGSNLACTLTCLFFPDTSTSFHSTSDTVVVSVPDSVSARPSPNTLKLWVLLILKDCCERPRAGIRSSFVGRVWRRADAHCRRESASRQGEGGEAGVCSPQRRSGPGAHHLARTTTALPSPPPRK